MTADPVYLHLEPGCSLPDLTALLPFRVVVVIEAEVSADWQAMVSEWLVRSGCLYMMAWGVSCSSWDDSVDSANLEQFNFEEIPDDKFVMTTWHQDEPLSDVLWYCKHNAFHPTVELLDTLLLHVSARSDQVRLLGAYAAA